MTRGVYERDWLRWGIKWLAPDPCECGGPRAVCWTAWTAAHHDETGSSWGVVCPSCKVADFKTGDLSNYLLVYETNPTPMRPMHKRIEPGIHVWMREGAELRAETLGSVLSSFGHLERARYIHINTPRQEWALEVRDDEVWAPWNPYTGSRKEGASLQFRKSKLRAIRWGERECVSCEAVLDAGATVWRPKERPAIKGDWRVYWREGGDVARWESRAMKWVMVCSPCVSKARVIESTEPGVMVGHLRVLTGDGA